MRGLPRYIHSCSAPRPRTPSRLGALGPPSRRRAGCKRVYPPRAVRRARPAEQNPKKGEKGVAHSSRAPPPGHARPRGWAHWNRPRVVGQGVRGYPPSCRAPRAACGLKRPKRKKGGLRSQYIFEPAKHRRAPAPGHACPRGGGSVEPASRGWAGCERLYPLVPCAAARGLRTKNQKGLRKGSGRRTDANEERAPSAPRPRTPSRGGV